MKHRMLPLLVLLLAGIASAGWLATGNANLPVAPVSKIIANSSSGTVIDVALPGVSIASENANGTAYDVVSIPGEVLAALDIGKPQVPKLSYLLGIPDNASVSVSVQVLETRTFDNVNCFPYQTPLKDGESNAFVIDRDFYQSNTSYPSYDARVMNTGIWRELAVGNIQVFPVHYNPGTKQLTVYSRFRVSVNYLGGSYAPKTIPGWLASTYARYIDNFDKLDIRLSPTDDDTSVKYLVISHDNWYNNTWLTDSLLGWHHKRGIQSRVIHKSSWTASEIRDSIKAEYNLHSPAQLRWVLLVGEYSEIPEYALGGVGHGDYYYSDLLPSSPDNYPEVGLSRLSPSDANDLGNQIKKILKFEKNPPTTSDWLSKHALIACSQEYPGKYSGCIRGIFNEPMAWYRYNFDTLMCQFHGNDSIARIINEGRGVVTYRGHGDWDEWYTLANAGGAPWYVSNVAALTNGDLTPMVYNICCLSGDISQGTCLSEEWMRKYPGGGAGSMAATQASYTYPNHGICSTLVRSMCDTWTITNPGYLPYTLPTWDIGWIQCNVDAYVAKYWPGSPYPDNIYMYLNLGDPAMEVWSGGQPQAANVVYPPTVPIGPSTLPVTVMVSGNPVQNALVCAWKAPDVYVTGITDPSGQTSLNISPSSPGSIYITVSGGHAGTVPHTPILPYEGTCIAQSGITPYVMWLRSTIDDAAGGNGDGIANPGEAINLPTWVKNSGGAQAHGVNARLHTADPFTTITDSAKTFGDINAGDSAFTGSTGFNFTIAPSCTNAHRIDLVMDVKDSNDSLWTSHIYVTVGAPVLAYTGYAVQDPAPGGNGNSRLDPGETDSLVVTLHNSGLGTAQSAFAFLRSGDSRLTVPDSFGGFGNIMPDSTRSNAGDQFQVYVDPSVPNGTMLPCTLHIGATGGYTATRAFTVTVGFLSPGALVLTLDTGACKLSVTGVGTLGYDLPAAPQQGIGFCWPKTAATGLYYGGMLCGNDSSYVVDHYYGMPASNVQTDWVMTDSLRFYPPTAGDQMTRTTYTDAGHPAPQGLQTVQTSYMDAHTGYNKFAVTVFDYYNSGASAINALYSGIMTDFDIGSTPSANDASTNDPRLAAFEYATGVPNPTMGVKLLYPHTAANLSVIDHDIYVYPTDTAMSEYMKYRFLDGQLHETHSDRSYDWSVVVSAGPFDLDPGARNRVAYAIVGGSDTSDFLANCDSAQSWYDRSLAVSEPGAEKLLNLDRVALSFFPNPFARSLHIAYTAPVSGRLLIKAFDASGRLVANIADRTVSAGRGAENWQPHGLANGVYFIKAILNGKESITKALLLR